MIIEIIRALYWNTENGHSNSLAIGQTFGCCTPGRENNKQSAVCEQKRDFVVPLCVQTRDLQNIEQELFGKTSGFVYSNVNKYSPIVIWRNIS